MSSKLPPKTTLATRAVRAGLESDAQHGSVVPPVYLSTNFAFEGYRRPRKYDYTRSGNPTRDQLAGALADLEEGAGAVITCTGLAAITLLLATLPKGATQTHVSLFDGSNCGIQLDGKPVFSVQYHPEASPGPRDSHYLFQRFADLMRQKKSA